MSDRSATEAEIAEFRRTAENPLARPSERVEARGALSIRSLRSTRRAVYIASETVTNIVINGSDVFNNITNVTVPLRRGDMVGVVYSAVPYMFFRA